MLALPLWYRRKVAEKARIQSKKNQQGLRPEIMDVTPEEVIKIMEHYQVQRLIHGHTHRPDIHSLQVNGQPATRIVLGDWYEQGSVLKVSANGFDLQTLRFHAGSTK